MASEREGRNTEESHPDRLLDKGMYPATGKRPRRTENTMIRSREERKRGQAADKAANAVTAIPDADLLFRGTRERGSAIRSESTSETRVRESVTGIRCRIRSLTAAPDTLSPHLPEKNERMKPR